MIASTQTKLRTTKGKKMKTRALIVIAATSFCMGCANISTIGRTTTLPPFQEGFITGTGVPNQGTSGREGSGLAIHLDAPQRVILTKSGFVCAEPSPDALQAYASSQGLSLDVPSEAEIKFANALATSAASTGLRTQSITLMRDHLYRICEAAYNKSITDLDVAQLLRRSQDMTLGILAIEQLTGAVVARQVRIDSSANAQASANLADTKAHLDRARTKEQSAKDSWDKAVEKEKKQKTLVRASQEKSDAAPDDKTLLEDLKNQKTQLARDSQEVGDAEKRFREAEKVTQVTQANYETADASASAAAQGKTEFYKNATNDNKIESSTINNISLATHNIVYDIITKGHLTDSCISIMNRFAMLASETQDGSAMKVQKAEAAKAVMKPLHDGCVKVFEANVERYVNQNTSPTNDKPHTGDNPHTGYRTLNRPGTLY